MEKKGKENSASKEEAVVYERLFKEHRHTVAETHNAHIHFKPTINKKSQQLSRREKIDEVLAQDRQRRQERKREHEEQKRKEERKRKKGFSLSFREERYSIVQSVKRSVACPSG